VDKCAWKQPIGQVNPKLRHMAAWMLGKKFVVG